MRNVSLYLIDSNLYDLLQHDDKTLEILRSISTSQARRWVLRLSFPLFADYCLLHSRYAFGRLINTLMSDHCSVSGILQEIQFGVVISGDRYWLVLYQQSCNKKAFSYMPVVILTFFKGTTTSPHNHLK